MVFASMLDRVSEFEDPTAPHPELQRQAARIRTDLDAFSDLEVRSLVMHGYCVARRALRTRPDLFAEEVPKGPPWNPIPLGDEASPSTTVTGMDAIQSTAEARVLRKSATRRVASRILSLRDWPTYALVPIAALLVLGLPYLVFVSFRDAQHNRQIIEAVAEMSPLYRTILARLDKGPVTQLTGLPYQDVEELPAAGLLRLQHRERHAHHRLARLDADRG